MNHARGSLFILAAVIAITPLGIAACSKKDNGPTGPGPTPELNSGNVANGSSYTHRFFTAGSYPYHCTIAGHSAMTGTVTVSDGAADTSVTINFPLSISPFPAATVKTGGKVVWANGTGMTHTVTST